MMNPTFFLWIGLLLSLVSAVLAFLLPRTLAYVWPLRLLSFSLLLGAVGSGLFLAGGDSTLSLTTNTWILGSFFHLDRLSAFFYLLVCGISAVVSWFGVSYLKAYETTYNLRALHALTALFIVGMQGVLISQTPLAFLFFWEVMSLTSYFLVFADKSTESIKASLLYLIMTHLGAGALFAGFMMVSSEQGSLLTSFADLSSASPSSFFMTESSGFVLVAFFLFLFGFGSKAGLWPFHVWLPEAHPASPSHISALMSGVMLKIALYGFLRVLPMFPPLPLWTLIVVMVIGLFSGVYGALYAVVERDVKRLLAYSSMENMGLLFTMVAVSMMVGGETIAMTAVFIHAVAHAVFKSGLFMGAGVLISQVHSRSLEVMGGLAKQLPTLSIAMLILALSASAIPPFSGFLGEWIFLRELVIAITNVPPFLSAVLIIVLATFAFVGGLSAFAMIKMFGMIFLGKPRGAHAEDHERSHMAKEVIKENNRLHSPILLFAIISAVFGLLLPMASSLIKIEEFSFVVFLLVLSFAIAWTLRRVFSKKGFERLSHTWDCGQPITSRMEYTATAFSAPMRFFFRQMLRTDKCVESRPVLASNPWIVSKTFSLDIRRLWFDLLYAPMAKAMFALSTFVRRLQNGVIQFYIALILLALVFTIVFLV